MANFLFDAVITAIAGLTIAGNIKGASKNVTIKALSGVPDTVNARECPVLFPDPVDFIGGVTVTRDSFGPGSGAAFTIEYDLKYTLAHEPIGDGRGLRAIEPGFALTLSAVLNALVVNDALGGAVDIYPAEVGNVGPVADPSGLGIFVGCQITVHVTELMN